MIQVPLCTLVTIAACVLVHLALGFFSADVIATNMSHSLVVQDAGSGLHLGHQRPGEPAQAAQAHQMQQLLAWAIAPAAVVYQHQWYWLLSSAFVHYGISHLGMNCISLLCVGAPVERLFGTMQMGCIVLIAAILCSLLYVSCCFAAFWWTQDVGFLYHDAVGISGVLFTLSVFESYYCASGINVNGWWRRSKRSWWSILSTRFSAHSAAPTSMPTLLHSRSAQVYCALPQ